MNRASSGLFILLLPLCSAAVADEFTVALGLINLSEDGTDIRVSFRQEGSHWQYGYRYVSWTDTYYDPFTGNAHSKTTDTLTGPGLNYLFRNEARHSAYAGMSLLSWTRTETSLIVPGSSGTAATMDLYFGGGYMGKFGSYGYYNAGLFLSPTARMKTKSAVSSTDQSGGFDPQLLVGLAW